jgi:hypothetical protein
MTAYVLVFLLLLVGGSLSLIENERARRSAYAVYLCFAIPILLVFAGLRGPNVDADYGLYESWFHGLVQGTLEENPFLKDPSFAIIGFGLNSVGLGIAALIAMYSAMCLAMQFSFIRQAVALRWLPLGMFLVLCRFFIGHEMTQIRSAVAIPLMSLAVLQFHARNKLYGSLLLLLAVSFHFSAILALPICLAAAFGIKFESRRWLVGLALSALLGYVAFSRISLLFAVFVRTKDYVTGAYETTDISLLSVYLLCRVALVAFAGIVLWKRLDPYERLLVICSSSGVMIEVALASNNALAIRGGELFGMFDVASALMIISYLRRRTAVIYVIFLLCLGGVFFRSSTKIIQPYASRLEI